jgi:glycosyltransferase involved in cell wall biosynthesis
VVIPSRDYARFLPAAIESVLCQTDPDLELLVVENGSTDDSLDVARRYEQSDSRVRVLELEEPSLPRARNHGMEQARGKYVAYLDADDIWVTDKLARQRSVLEDRQDVGLVGGLFGSIDTHGSLLSSGRRLFTPIPRRDPLRSLVRGNSIGTPSTVLFRRQIFEQGIRFDESHRHMEDWHFYLQVAALWQLHMLPTTVAYHRLHDRNLQADHRTMRRQTLQTVEVALEVAQERLGFDATGIASLRRSLLATVDEVQARELLKTGAHGCARRLLARSLRRFPVNPRAAVLLGFATLGFLPHAVKRRLR